jgi:SM-20-related protein
MSLLDLEAFQRTPLTYEPFEHLVVGDFLRPKHVASVLSDFPAIAGSGLLPVDATAFGPAFGSLVEEIESAALSDAFAAKFGIALSPRHLMTTVRGRCDGADGRIHADSRSKVVTALLYLNESWANEGGRLRLLRSAGDIDDVIAEIPPCAGTLVAFRRTEHSFHGHKPYVGVRRYVMFNWMTDDATARREMMRHRLSAKVKRMMPRFGRAR